MPSRAHTTLKTSLFTFGAAGFCLLFGLAYIANIHPVGDGLWYWYGTLFRGKQRLYADLHFNLQPLFVLLTAAGQLAFGTGWLASKVLPTMQLVTYVLLLLVVVRRAPWKDWERAVLIIAVFGMMIATPFFRFDDYHITTNLFVMGGVVLLLRLQERPTAKAVFIIAPLLGLLSGFSMMNRLNDGAGLLVACLLVLPFSSRQKRVPALLLLVAFALLGVFGTVLLTGDTIPAWASESIFKAAKIKGGTEHILLFPLRLPFKALHLGRYYPAENSGLIGAMFVIGILLPLQALVTGENLRRRSGTWIVIGFMLVATYPSLWWFCTTGNFDVPIADIAIAPLYALNLWVLYRLLLVSRRAAPANWRPQEALLLLPFLQLLSSAATSGISMPMVAPAVATSLLLLPISLPVSIPAGWQQRSAMTAICFLAVVSYPPKWMHPYFWHYYNAGPMFQKRLVYHHPTLGPMLLERSAFEMIKPFCDRIHQDPHEDQLLSLPYPYPNYFCGIPPWHGYVQTWFDTSGPDLINRLIGELQLSPPKWIVYQRMETIMKMHEEVFLNKKALPHRELDKLLVAKIKTGAWKVVDYKELDGSDWFLIQTRP